MRDDEKLMYRKMILIVDGQDAELASNAAMNLVAGLIVNLSPSLKEAELGAQHAAEQIGLMVKEHWKAQYIPSSGRL